MRRRQRTVLVTGFEPFDGAATNPSGLAARALDGRTIAGRRVVGAVLPVTFGDAIAALGAQLRATRPELVICTGLADARGELSIERVAINVDDARIPDNAGARPIDRAIARRGPVGYWSTLPIKSIAAALSRAHVPAAISQTAGTFVCNHVFYGLMRALARRRGVRGGFIHVPPVRRLALATIVDGLAVAIATALRTRRDARIAAGAVS
nr:pyroglutamyl-peptidase I [Kofleriaceae bacterium]